MIHAHRLLREHRIILPHTMQFDTAEIDDDGILVLDLRLAKLSQRRSPRIERHKRYKAEHEWKQK
ncbi:MAG: hypothetical protein IPO41_06440 [Acidobacteria bacterium]|nr:hypothetical protein [Acidobacteriota bacterium]